MEDAIDDAHLGEEFTSQKWVCYWNQMKRKGAFEGQLEDRILMVT